MRWAINLVILSFLVGCVSTKITSFRDPEFRTGYSIGKIVVGAPELPLTERLAVETKFVEAFEKASVVAVRAVDLLPPTRQFTGDQIAQILDQNSVDTLLLMVGYMKSTQSTYIPQTHYPGQTTGTVNYIGNTAYFQAQTSPGFTAGGFSVKKPVFSYTLNLSDHRTGKIVWTASGTGRGNKWANAEDFGHSTAATTLAELKNEGFLPKQK